MKITGNEPAYPLDYEIDGNYGKYRNYNEGMTIRTELAARAMQGMLANAPFNTTDPELISGLAIKYTDALIKELNKEKL